MMRCFCMDYISCVTTSVRGLYIQAIKRNIIVFFFFKRFEMNLSFFVNMY